MREFLLTVVMIALCASVACGSEVVTCQQLINEAGIWDGRIVRITGEVVGDILRKGGHIWLNIHDGTNALGVWADAGIEEELKIIAGDYSGIGTVLDIEGEFHRTCGMHSGETDIHLSRATVREEARSTGHPVKPERTMLAGALVIIALGIALIKRKRPSKGRTANP